MSATFTFNGDLANLLRGKRKARKSITVEIDRRASVKDMLESFGLPHTEIGTLAVNNTEIDFNWIVSEDTFCTVDPVTVPWYVTRSSLLRPDPLPAISFLVDVNVGRLARYLRAAGFDTLYDHRWDDDYIADLLRQEERILLTRDLRLLMRKHIVFGRYVRATDPVEQFREVINLFGLEEKITPFSRCLDCNSLLEPVDKDAIMHRLEPLTRKYYSTFSVCPSCDKIFWEGSHIENLRQMLYEK